MAALTKPRRKLFSLFFPLLLESMATMLLGVVDTVFLAQISDNAVGAAGTSAAYLAMFYLVFSVVSSGVLAVMLQYYGSNQKGVVYQARQLGILFNGAIGLVLSITLVIAAPWIIEAIGVSEALRDDATIYFHIVGAACIFDALVPVFACYLRAFDKVRYTLIAGMAANIVNLALDAIFIFACGWGVPGAAAATVIGKVVNLGLCILFSRILVKGKQYKERVSNRLLAKQIIKIGLPGAVEMTAYSVSVAVVMAFLNRIDPTGFDAKVRSVAAQITSFSYCAAFAFSQANAIMVGWHIGEGKQKECYPITRFSSLIAIGAGVLVELIFALVSPWLCQVFTPDTTLINVVRIVLFIDIALEVGRAVNLVYGNTLKTAGDAIFPMAATLIVTTLVLIGGSYLFAVVLRMGAIGAYIALAADECIRGVIILIRWQSGKWEKKALVKTKPEESEPSLEQENPAKAE